MAIIVVSAYMHAHVCTTYNAYTRAYVRVFTGALTVRNKLCMQCIMCKPYTVSCTLFVRRTTEMI